MSKAEETARLLKERIAAGDFNEKLPSEKELAGIFGVAPNTVGKAVRLLAAEGLVTRQQGNGTFLRCPNKRKIKVAALPWLFNALTQVCSVEFPDVELIYCNFDADPHITTITSFFPLEYNRFLDFMPEEIYEEAAKDYRFFPAIRDLHCVGRICYGIPAYFSPVLIAWNKKLMKKLAPDFSPEKISFEMMIDLMKKASSKGISGLDVKYFAWHILTTILANFPGEQIGWESFEKSRSLISALLPLLNEGKFAEGKSLFTLVSRHLIRREFSDPELSFEVMPIPFSGKTRRCNVASEALAVKLQAPGKELLWKIVRLSWGEKFQKIIAEDRHSIPLDRALAIETLDNNSNRDDIFFSEIRNIDFTRARLPFQVMRETALEFSSVVRKKISSDDFYKHIQKTFSQCEYESMRDRRIQI